MPGFIKIHRQIRQNWIYQDAEFFKVWMEMLLVAQYSPEKKFVEGELIDLNTGDFVYGRPSWSERLKISERRLRTLVKHLIDDGMIKQVSTHKKFTIFNILNYEKYNVKIDQQNDQHETETIQPIQETSDQQNDQLTTNKRPTNDHIKEVKEVKNNNKYVLEFETFWKEYPRSIGKSDALKCWNARIKEKYSPDDLITSAINYAAECKRKGTETQYIKHPKTFLSKTTPFADYIKKQQPQTVQKPEDIPEWFKQANQY